MGRITARAVIDASGRIVIRALVLMALGYALTALHTGVDVILSFYGLLFLLVLPLRRLSARTLAVIAAGGALVMPQVLYLIRQPIEAGDWADTVIAGDQLAWITGTDGFMELLFTGEYPVLTWMSFMVAGMAVARLDLTRARTLAQLSCLGAALALLGYDGSWSALHLVPHALGAVAAPPTASHRLPPGGPTRSATSPATLRPPGCWWPHRAARPRSPSLPTRASHWSPWPYASRLRSACHASPGRPPRSRRSA
ncbi:hypothetical protein [Streptomyces sp. MBT65]|uniref:hypothetical protein n=1 Tax=Streptomyces sp. MBT65 TaxID=1488395 RepID=UPI0027DA4504|nr:hypothetical protein [Streptomyces sp. MBT65]